MDFLTQLSGDAFSCFLLIWCVLCISSSVAMHFGRMMPISNREERSGLAILGTIDKKAGWIILETPILITTLFFYLAALNSGAQAFNLSVVFVALFLIHYSNRALVYPFRLKVKGKRMPILIMLFAMIFYIVNGYMMGHYFGALRSYPIEWLWDPRFMIGAVLFAFGMFVNIWSDNILINLRKPGETEYKIARRGFFRWVSCPNYFGEIVEWIGFAIMSWSAVGAVFALWVTLPLLAQGGQAHRWYREQFGDEYPAERRAVIPYIW